MTLLLSLAQTRPAYYGPATFRCGIQMTGLPRDAAPVYTDMAGRLKSFSFRRGRERELGRSDAGTATIVLSNADRALDPTNIASPHYGSLKPMQGIQITATLGGEVYPVFTGFVERWPMDYDESVDDEDLTLIAVDAFAWLSRDTITTASYGIQLTGTRVGAALDTDLWPAERRQIDSGLDQCQAHTVTPQDGQTVLEEIQTAADTEYGIAFIDGRGYVVFQGRLGRTTGLYVGISAVFGDDQSGALPEYTYRRLTPSLDVDDIVNDCTVTRTGGTAQNYQRASSIDSYGKRSKAVSTFHSTDGDALTMATYIVNQRSDPLLDVRRMEYDAVGDASLWAAALGLEIGRRIRVNLRPPIWPRTAQYSSASPTLTTATDSFNRANTGPPPSLTEWETDPWGASSGGHKVVTNQCVPNVATICHSRYIIGPIPPTMRTLDAFTRADENPLAGIWAGPGWVDRVSQQLRLVSGQARAQAVANTTSYIVAAQPVRDQDAIVTWAGFADWAGVSLRCTDPTVNPESNYSIWGTGTYASWGMSIERWLAGVGVTIASSPYVPPLGTRFRLRAVGAVLSAYAEIPGAGWVLTCSAVDTNLTAPGWIQANIHSSSALTALDDIAAGPAELDLSDCEVGVSIATAGAAGNTLAVLARVGATGQSGYRLELLRGGGTDTLTLYRDDRKLGGSLATLATLAGIALGSQAIRLQCAGNGLRGWYKNSGGSWVLAVTATDTGYNAGYTELVTVGGGWVLDDWYGAAITPYTLTRDCAIESVQGSWSGDAPTKYTVAYTLSASIDAAAVWVLDSSTASILNSTTVLVY